MSAPTADRKATGVFSPGRAEIPQRTLRTDNWLKSPIWTDLGLAAIVIYATARAFMQDHFYVEQYNYLTPFYSPCVVNYDAATGSGCPEGDRLRLRRHALRRRDLDPGPVNRTPKTSSNPAAAFVAAGFLLFVH